MGNKGENTSHVKKTCATIAHVFNLKSGSAGLDPHQRVIGQSFDQGAVKPFLLKLQVAIN
ncbi:MAG: hypothetical protein AVO34_12375 [Firmicutes bacterium ML8_F2]|jgi:hypothetical protein|nr:MAG: hypothetical protein AVO34_12375 [Firmicutes bacterium ML8_F2]